VPNRIPAARAQGQHARRKTPPVTPWLGGRRSPVRAQPLPGQPSNYWWDLAEARKDLLRKEKTALRWNLDGKADVQRLSNERNPHDSRRVTANPHNIHGTSVRGVSDVRAIACWRLSVGQGCLGPNACCKAASVQSIGTAIPRGRADAASGNLVHPTERLSIVHRKCIRAPAALCKELGPRCPSQRWP